MGLPLSFLCGLLLVLGREELRPALPGSGSLWTLLLVAPAALVPGYLARRLQTAPPRVARLGLRLFGATLPLAYAPFVFVAELPDLTETWLPASATGRLLLQLAPLLLIELSLRAEARLRAWLDAHAPAFTCSGNRLPMIAFLLAPLLLITLLLDVASRERGVELFFQGTSLGVLLGLLLVSGVLCALMPLLFRWLMPVSVELERHAAVVQDGARQCAFPPRSILRLDTGHRHANAMLVGPLPWPRYLLLTDGLLSILDPQALRGVIAHEVGHARCYHAGLLLVALVLVPLLLLHPAVAAGLDDLDWVAGWTVALGMLALALVVLRLLSHRFEYEADELAARALGGAQACVQALLRVGEAFTHGGSRSSLRHPSDRDRIAHLLRCEADPEFRGRFVRRGRRLRTLIGVAVVVAVMLSAFAHWRLWPAERAATLLWSGQALSAEAQLAAAGEVPAAQQRFADELREEIAAARELGVADGDWESVRARIAGPAWERGLAALRAEGPRAARRWFALATSKRWPSAVERSVYRYCAAVAEGDAEEAAALLAHLQRLELPEDLRVALGSPAASRPRG